MKVTLPIVCRYFIALTSDKEIGHQQLTEILAPDVKAQTWILDSSTQQEQLLVECANRDQVLAILDRSIFDNIEQAEYNLASYVDNQNGEVVVQLTCRETRNGNGTETEGPGTYQTAGRQTFIIANNQIVKITINIESRQKIN